MRGAKPAPLDKWAVVWIVAMLGVPAGIAYAIQHTIGDVPAPPSNPAVQLLPVVLLVLVIMMMVKMMSLFGGGVRL